MIEMIDNTTVKFPSNSYGISEVTVPSERLDAFLAGEESFAEAFSSVQNPLAWEALKNALSVPPPEQPVGLLQDEQIEMLLTTLAAYDQANDAFMIEREQAAADIALLRSRLADQEVMIDAYRSLYINAGQAIETLQGRIVDAEAELFDAEAEIENLNDILLSSSRYVGKAKELLANISITVETEADGTPSLSVNTNKMINAVVKQYQTQAGGNT